MSGGGRPLAIRCDNGPENISGAIQNWAQQTGIAFQYIQPGKPQQNAYIERFNRTVRYEWLSQYYWKDLDKVRDHAAQWLWYYNHQRPNMAVGGITTIAAQLYFSPLLRKERITVAFSADVLVFH